MKRTAAAGTFALLAGGATLLLLASIVYSCGMSSDPHNRNPGARGSVRAPSPDVAMHFDRRSRPAAPARLDAPPSAERL